MPTSQLLLCYCVNLKIEGHLTFLPPRVVGQQLTSKGFTRLVQLIVVSTWELLEQKRLEPNKLRMLFLCKWSKENPTSSRIVNSFWAKLIPSWMGHTIGTIGLRNYKFSRCSTNATIQVIWTKLMLMVLEWSDVILYLKTWITWNRSSIYKFAKVDPYLHLNTVVFYNAKHWIAELGGQHSIHHWSSTKIFSFNSKPPRDTKGSNLLELNKPSSTTIHSCKDHD
jgi:hypothetical protein